MFAIKPRMAIALRVFLIAVILFNALAPTFASAKSLLSKNAVGSSENQITGRSDKVSLAENNYRQRFVAPTSNAAKHDLQSQSPMAQTYNATLQCISNICTDQEPGIYLSEHYSGSFRIGWVPPFWLPRDMGFKINCAGIGCTQQNDVFYHSVYTNTFSSPYYVTELYVATGGKALQNGTGTRYHVYCSSGYSGTCTLETWGVIRGGIIDSDPSKNSHFSIFSMWEVGTMGSGDWETKDWLVEVSFDPSLLESEVPAESANCKGCYYGTTQGWAADPINTRTGALSYSINDMEIPTSAGPLSFRRTYISSLKDQFASPLGYGWVHNQDIRLILPANNEPNNQPSFVKFKDPSGNLYRFWNIGDGTYVAYAGYTATLTKNASTPITYTLTDQFQNVYTFDEIGKVKSLVNTVDQTLTYAYVNGQLSKVSYDATHYLEFHYDLDNPDRLKSVNNQTGRSVTFYYDPNGDLDYFDDVLGERWHYTYDNHLLTEILDENLDPIQRNEYYPDGRAKKQFEGNNIKPIVELTYNPDGTTTITDASGSRSHAYNSLGTLTGDRNVSMI